MKTAVLALVTLLFVGVARADTVVVDLAATNAGYYDQFFGLVDLQAELTMQLVTGTFFDPGRADFVIGPHQQPTPVYELTGIRGTLNGNPISFFQDPVGDGSWLWPDLTLGAIYFSVNGDEAWLENDIDYSLISIPSDVDRIHGNGSPINYSTHIVSTPEPGLLLALPCLLLVLAVFVNERRKQTKVS
jgi:hypothetical protein